MEKMRTGTLLLCWLLLCGLILLAGCRDQDGEGRCAAHRTGLRQHQGYPGHHPHLYGGEMAAQGMVFEPLVVYTAEGGRPWLAESWEISPDGRVGPPTARAAA